MCFNWTSGFGLSYTSVHPGTVSSLTLSVYHGTKVLEPLLAFLQFLPHFIPSTSRLLLTQSLPLGEHHIYVSLVLFIPPRGRAAASKHAREFLFLFLFFVMHGYTHSLLQYLHSYLDYLQKTGTYTRIICNISCSVWWIPSLTLYKGLHYLDYLQCGTYILTVQYDHLRY